MEVDFIKITSIGGMIGWGFLALFVSATDGIGDGPGSFRSPPPSFFLPFVYFIICIISCFLPRCLLMMAGIMGTVCLGIMIYILIMYGWLPIISVILIGILVCHGTCWWTMITQRTKKFKTKD